MSYDLDSRPVFDTLSFGNSGPGFLGASETSAQRAALDLTIDAALRNVKLPEGLLMRLGRLVNAMPSDAADEVDWLGC